MLKKSESKENSIHFFRDEGEFIGGCDIIKEMFEKKELQNLYSIRPKSPMEKIESVKNVFVQSGATKELQLEIEYYTERAFEVLNSLALSDSKKGLLRKFGEGLMKRKV